jgi:hypothetical protein
MSLTTKKNLILRIGIVESVDDEYHGGRIKVRLANDKLDENIPYAYPLLPYMIHVLPKVGEAVLLVCSDIKSSKSTRFYIGPLIHQPQFANYDSFFNSTSLLKGFNQATLPSVDRNPETLGAYPKKDEIAIIGRKDGDIIISDNDVRIRCGVHITDKDNPTDSVFNKLTPSFIKLKTHENKLSNGTNTTATIVSENINLISTVGSPGFTVTDTNESISDEEINKIIENAHQLPYGDILLDFLKLFLRAFNSHTHPYSGKKPIPNLDYTALNEFKMNSMLSKNVKIN